MGSIALLIGGLFGIASAIVVLAVGGSLYLAVTLWFGLGLSAAFILVMLGARQHDKQGMNHSEITADLAAIPRGQKRDQ